MFFLLITLLQPVSFFFFFNDTATTEIYTLSLHDALPISHLPGEHHRDSERGGERGASEEQEGPAQARSEDHTSELQSPCNLVCRLLLEKKKKKVNTMPLTTSDNSLDYITTV